MLAIDSMNIPDGFEWQFALVDLGRQGDLGLTSENSKKPGFKYTDLRKSHRIYGNQDRIYGR